MKKNYVHHLVVSGVLENKNNSKIEDMNKILIKKRIDELMLNVKYRTNESLKDILNNITPLKGAANNQEICTTIGHKCLTTNLYKNSYLRTWNSINELIRNSIVIFN